jgi:hypothetical protein
MSQLKKAADSGMMARNTIDVPCIVKSWLNISAETTFMFGPMSWARMIAASTPPHTKKNSDVIR